MAINKKIIISAGGTGGHIFPATALQEELQKQGYEIFFFTDDRFKNYHINCKKHVIFSGSPALNAKGLKGFSKMLMGIYQSIFLLIKIRPAIVIGFGGYPSFPPLFAAKLLGIKTILHEQNSIIGKVNDLMSKFTSKLAIGFANTKHNAPYDKVVYTGNPIRKEFNNHKIEFIKNDNEFNIVVIGGSQGASIFAQIIPQALNMLSSDLQKQIHITQQCKNGEEEDLITKYANMNIKHEISPFFTDIDVKMNKAHLIICRAGASTISEILATKRPAIIVPLPTSAANHQLYNAKFLADNEACILLEQKNFISLNLASKIEYYIKNPEKLLLLHKNLITLHQNNKPVHQLADIVKEVINDR
jgi:UDP-N-acetylglucosamine--N-acetylmuramyl-(pentapeptide) pyrophosphoryl-undecaprenol N-acetylglucosamine transferase